MARTNKGQREIEITKDVERFIEMDWNRYKKENRYFMKERGKAAIKESFYQEMTFYLGDAIEFYIKYNMLEDYKAEKICTKIVQNLAVNKGEFIAYLVKLLKEYGMKELKREIPKIQFFPIVLRFIIGDIMEAKPEFNITKDAPELEELYRLMNKKKLNKAKKLKLDMSFAYDVVGIMPTPDAFEYGRRYRAYDVITNIYKWADNLVEAGNDVSTIFNWLFRDTQFETIIFTALMAKQSKLERLTENQKKMAAQITDWCFDELEMMPERDINRLINRYFQTRKNSEKDGNDEPRRFYFGSIPDTKYPKIVSVITDLTTRYKDYEKYL